MGHAKFSDKMSRGIKDFYGGRSVLVTGATGFMGKVLVEKLLRSCSQIKNIYVLIRPKAGEEVQQRMEQLLSSKIFDKVKQEQPDAIGKLVVIPGDISLLNLGICTADENTLVENVSVVFHGAATLKFAEEFKKSIEMNARGTKQILDLCHRMTHFAALVHVSTAYCNCDRHEIEEVVYTFPQNPHEVMRAMEWMDKDCIKAIEPHLVGVRPNTYTYTKALAESILLVDHGNLSVAIVRPSIVGPTWKEPFVGWIDSLNALSGLILGYGKGALRSGYCNPNMGIDIVPVDVCTNLMIAAAYYANMHRSNEVSVFNCTSGSINRATYGEIFNYLKEGVIKYPLENIMWYPSLTFQRTKSYHEFVSFFVHYLPAYFIDAIMWALGKKTFMVNVQRRIQKGCGALEYFGNNEWRFSNTNVSMLTECLSGEDRKEFDFNMQPLDWASYLENCFFGSKIYLSKEDVTKLPHARRNLRRMYYIRHLAHIVAVLSMWRLLMICFDIL